MNSVWLSNFWCRPSEKILSHASPAVAPVLVSNSLVLKLNLLISLAICIFDNWARRARAYVISSLQFKHWLVILKLAYGFYVVLENLGYMLSVSHRAKQKLCNCILCFDVVVSLYWCISSPKHLFILSDVSEETKCIFI